MGRKLELDGKEFGDWTVLHKGKVDKYGHQYWLCKCSCGTVREILGDNLIRNQSLSCGCRNKEKLRHTHKVKQPNKFYIEDDYIVLLDENQNECLVDKDSYPILCNYYWKKNKEGYWIAWDNAINKNLKIHRVIMFAKEGEIIDHIFGNRSDNRKSNLRFCTAKQNAWNTRQNKSSSSPCPGVRQYYRANSKYNWKVMYHSHGKGHHIGLFETFEEAAYARKYLERMIRGEFVNLSNFPNIILDTAKQKSTEEKIIKKIKEKHLI